VRYLNVWSTLCLLVFALCHSPLLIARTLDELLASGHLQISSSLTPADNIVPGQKIQLTLETATDRWFAGGTRLTIPEVAGLIILQTEQFASNASESRNGQTWVIQRWTLDVYPQRAGTFEIPPIRMQLKVNTSESGNLEGVAYSQAVRFSAVIPKSLSHLQQWIAAPTLTIRQSFDRDLDGLVVGDAFEQKIEFEATDMMAMMLPEYTPPQLSGLAAYPAPATLDNNANRGQSIATRVFHISYVLEAPGQYLLPAREYFWWNTTTRELQLLSIAETRIEVAGNSTVLDATVSSFKLRPRQVLVLLAGLGLALILLLLARRVLPRLPFKKLHSTLSALAIRWRALRKPALAKRLNPGNSAED
jgi:hypothetical protein